MATFTAANSARAPLSTRHKDYFTTAIYPVVQALARKRFAFIRCPGRRDDAVADAVASAWTNYRYCVQHGRPLAPPDRLARWAVQAAMCRWRPARFGHAERPSGFDALDRRAQ